MSLLKVLNSLTNLETPLSFRILLQELLLTPVEEQLYVTGRIVSNGIRILPFTMFSGECLLPKSLRLGVV